MKLFLLLAYLTTVSSENVDGFMRKVMKSQLRDDTVQYGLGPKVSLRKTKYSFKCSKKKDAASCQTCLNIVGAAQAALEGGLPWSALEEIVIEQCIETGFQTERFCRGYVANFGPEFQYIYENSELTPDILCAILDSPGCGAWDDMNDWFVDIPDGKPERIEPQLPDVMCALGKNSNTHQYRVSG